MGLRDVLTHGVLTQLRPGHGGARAPHTALLGWASASQDSGSEGLEGERLKGLGRVQNLQGCPLEGWWAQEGHQERW